MTLADLTLPMPLADCKDLALVYSYEIAAALYDLQQSHGDRRHVCYGRPLVDGRWMIDGEILAMVGDGGIYGWVSAHMTLGMMEQIDMVPLDEAKALLVPPEPE